ncbi:bifunctional DNA-formamidopyrimidine glycosylase/DNA-(apurinic or apyrimidinic site) lyase [Longimicrobium terrae]|uniref:Formamidopyrimidine-DNA glycosylase n=1 Tax=Longimicrobium terrae TaxID=1639882 RepID=A0A841GPN8_9BACT|nr:bifunctional DNA-formamidopyrimidine glycosylase/DNA-(apurinic or apyrimidinic site) lyase [Longimicrobium terrae]MBB4634948.1 formamidopyrimidine-DNA glycosylase [Longimicrobium terrae]MBB6069342.1 formamidopyrimidine-DNA glycosylase [Longimicrobium terrae]NNC31849.1 bifunctional DNA-formamidopyrimidine glycosylase/DNA-(apurinic or apyrimidinic site) lyase [Longimicrobium terrae]
MPELPEVETIVRDLSHLLPGAKVRGVTVLRPDLIEGESADEFAARLKGKKIRGVTRRAKNIVTDLGGERLLVNLGMTGRLLVAREGEEETGHLGVRIALDGGRELRYHDARRFGRLWIVGEDAWRAWDGELGVEPLSDDFTAEWLLEKAARSRVAVKTWLMDQARVVGVGNIYASEGLFRAGVDPRRPANSLTADEAERVVAGVRRVLGDAIEHRGTTFLDYRDARGERGGFAARLQVYDQEGEPCPVCAAPIERIVQGGRSTFFCGACQS